MPRKTALRRPPLKAGFLRPDWSQRGLDGTNDWRAVQAATGGQLECRRTMMKTKSVDVNMSRKKSKHKQGIPFPWADSLGRPLKGTIWVETVPHNNPIDPRINERLQPILLDLVMIEDVRNPLCPGFDKDDYVRQYAHALREPIACTMKTAGFEVTEDQFREICRLSGSEAFVVRGLSAAIRIGEITLDHIRHLDLYQKYQDYFDKSPAYRAKALAVAALVVASDRKKTETN